MAAKDVKTYLAGIAPKQRRALKRLQKLIREAAPAAEESIGYGQPYYKQDGPLVSFAAFKNHCSFFPMSSATIRQFRAELKDYETAKGTVRFTVAKPLPETLVIKMVKARLAENRERKARRGQ